MNKFNVLLYSVTSCLFAALLTISDSAEAKVIPKSSIKDSRIRHVTYDADNVTEIPVAFGQVVTIELGNEQITTTAQGDTLGWQVVKMNNRIFIKPATPSMKGVQSTNLNVITNKRNYYFRIYNTTRNNAPYVVRFKYPGAVKKSRPGTSRLPAETHILNSKYMMSGDKEISVRRVYDDGTFTYFEFSGKSALPVIYIVNEDGKEEVANFRKRGNKIVVEKINRMFSLRLGKKVKCIRNTDFVED